MMRLLLATIAAVLSTVCGLLNLRHASRGGVGLDAGAWGVLFAMVAFALVLMPLYIRDARPRRHGHRPAAWIIGLLGVAGICLNIASLRQSADNMETFRSPASRPPVLPTSAPAR